MSKFDLSDLLNKYIFVQFIVTSASRSKSQITNFLKIHHILRAYKLIPFWCYSLQLDSQSPNDFSYLETIKLTQF